MQIRHEIYFGARGGDLKLFRNLNLDQVPRKGESIHLADKGGMTIDSVQWIEGGGVVIRTHGDIELAEYYRSIGYGEGTPVSMPAEAKLSAQRQPNRREEKAKAYDHLRQQLRELLWMNGMQTHPDVEDKEIVERLTGLLEG